MNIELIVGIAIGLGVGLLVWVTNPSDTATYPNQYVYADHLCANNGGLKRMYGKRHTYGYGKTRYTVEVTCTNGVAIEATVPEGFSP